MKKLTGWGIALVSLAALVFLVAIRSGVQIALEDIIVDKDAWYEIIAKRERAESRLVEHVRFNQEEIITAEDGAEWYYSLVEGQASARNPRLSYSGQEGVKLAVFEKGITDEGLAKAEPIKVMAYTDKEYEIHELKYTTLPIMKIRHAGALELNSVDEEEAMDLELFDNSIGATRRYVLTGGKIRVRGAFTAIFPKKSFRMKLKTTSVGENKRPDTTMLLDLRQDDDWILYAVYNDQEKVRNVFATNLWKMSQVKNNEFGVDNGVEYKYVELIMNDKYHGLYALTYPVDEIQLGLRMGMKGYEEFIFKKVNWGGIDTYELKTELNEPKMAWEELKDFYDTMQVGQDAEKVREMMDMANAIDMHLFIEMALNIDIANIIPGEQVDDMVLANNVGDTKNLYLTAKKRGEGYAWMYTPWDSDLTFGNICTTEEPNIEEKRCYMEPQKDYEIMSDAVWKLKMLGDEKIEDELSNRYKELRAGAWSDENIEEMIDQYEAKIYGSGAFVRDQARWPEGSHNEAGEGLEKFRQYVLTRMRALDEKYL
jgi:hypothetical protein